MEALHYGLPVIGFPFYTDQFYNMRFVVENGFGIEILLNDLQANVLDDAIGKLISDKRYFQTGFQLIINGFPATHYVSKYIAVRVYIKFLRNNKYLRKNFLCRLSFLFQLREKRTEGFRDLPGPTRFCFGHRSLLGRIRNQERTGL